jgi:hypothetical protein
MDLASIDLRKASEKPNRLTIRNPQTGEPTDAWIEMLGPDSALALSIHEESATFFAKRAQRQGLADPKKEKEEFEQHAAHNMAKICTDWGGISFGKDKDLEFSYENATMIFSNPLSRWVRQQVERFHSDRANFTEA